VYWDETQSVVGVWLCLMTVMTWLQAGSGHLCSVSKCHFLHLGMKYVQQQKMGMPARPHAISHSLYNGKCQSLLLTQRMGPVQQLSGETY
jgi:hypothetical protein